MSRLSVTLYGGRFWLSYPITWFNYLDHITITCSENTWLFHSYVLLLHCPCGNTRLQLTLLKLVYKHTSCTKRLSNTSRIDYPHLNNVQVSYYTTQSNSIICFQIWWYSEHLHCEKETEVPIAEFKTSETDFIKVHVM